MKYGLPVGVRDSLLAQAENQVALPKSDVGQRYYYEQQALMNPEYGQLANTVNSEMQDVVPSRQLDRFSRALQVVEARSKTAFRNLPKLCSFWLNGSCSRVVRKTCPFRPCCGTFVFPEIAGSNRELCAKLVERLEKEGPAAVQKSLDAETKEAIRESLKGNKEDAIRKRVGGDDELTKKYLGKMKNMVRIEVTDCCDIDTSLLLLLLYHKSYNLDILLNLFSSVDVHFLLAFLCEAKF
jgi:hypothetical protein